MCAKSTAENRSARREEYRPRYGGGVIYVFFGPLLSTSTLLIARLGGPANSLVSVCHQTLPPSVEIKMHICLMVEVVVSVVTAVVVYHFIENEKTQIVVFV